MKNLLNRDNGLLTENDEVKTPSVYNTVFFPLVMSDGFYILPDDLPRAI